jgi:hypothetical protein
MKFASRTFAPCLAAVAMAAVALRAVAAAPVPARPTEVTVFEPAVPHGPSRSGECWTDSIAVARPGGWRCAVDNEIYDPCFSSPELTGAVICDANPATKHPGFVLTLTKPLPNASTGTPTYPRPWLVKLADGARCEIETGTIASVNGLDVPYGCSDSRPCDDVGCPYMTGLTATFKRGKVWMADKVTFRSSAKGLKLLGRKRVAVTAVWK